MPDLLSLFRWPLLVLLFVMLGTSAQAQQPRPGPDADPVQSTAKNDPADEAEKEGADDDNVSATPDAAEPLTAAQRQAVEAMIQQRLAELPAPQVPSMKLSWKGDAYSKFIFRNNQSNGCVTWGSPHPLGDNFSGDNGMCSELGLTLKGQVSRLVEVQARLQTRFGQQWADWYENGDQKPGGLDTTGESQGMNHAAYLQLRGLYLRVSPPIPTVHYIHLGSSDLSQYNAFTVGKVRYIDRFNANGVFINGGFWDLVDYELARIALPKLFASAGYNTGIDDPLVANPFWARDAAYVLKLSGSPWDILDLRWITSALLDEEADTDDPDALGSTNVIDARDGIVQTNFRYFNANSTLEAEADPLDFMHLKGLFGLSYQRPDSRYVFNAVANNQGISPVPMKELSSYAAIVRADFYDPLDLGLDLKLEYFNIGADWVSTFGARRETDVLLTDGFVGGQVPTLNVANEFMDFTEEFYESIIGWHGLTAVGQWSWDALTTELEGTFIEYNTDAQDRDVDSQYPDFLFTDGMTDTDMYSYANTNDRGRDPRSVYHRNQARRTVISMFKAKYSLDFLEGFDLESKFKYIWDADQRDQDLQPDPSADDYLGQIMQARFAVQGGLSERLHLGMGYQLDYWIEANRSGDLIAGRADYADYLTIKHKVFVQLFYLLDDLRFAYRMELLDKTVTTTKPSLDFHVGPIVRSLGSVSVNF